MAELKARHAFGSSSKIDAALEANKIDAFDILFLDGDTAKPKVGWIDKDGLLKSAEKYGKSPYGQHLKAVAEGKVRG